MPPEVTVLPWCNNIGRTDRRCTFLSLVKLVKNLKPVARAGHQHKLQTILTALQQSRVDRDINIVWLWTSSCARRSLEAAEMPRGPWKPGVIRRTRSC